MSSKGEKGAPTVRIERSVYEEVMKQRERASKSSDPTLRAASLSTQGWISFLLERAMDDMDPKEKSKE